MGQISAKTRIAFGLVCLVGSVLMAAQALELVPDHRSAVLDGRAKLAEALAINGSVHISSRRFDHLADILEVTVERNPQMLSAAVRNDSGELLVEIGEHTEHWKRLPGDRSTDSQIQVTLRSGKEAWGQLEIRFTPLSNSGFAGVWENPWCQLILFSASCCFLLFYFYLQKVLQHLDPSQAVPGRVNEALDELVEGLLVLDRRQRIILANHTFAQKVGQTPEKLLGRPASDFPWMRLDDEERPEQFPWNRALETGLPQANVMMRLMLERNEPLTFVVNSSPVIGHDGKYHGVLVSFDEIAQNLRQAKKQPKAVRINLPPARILVVDDGETNRQLVSLVLTRAGVQTEEAEDGQQAFDRAMTEQFDLILMDMQMPVMDGYVATSKLRQQNISIPIIALTANALQGDEEKCLQAGCTGFLNKPIDIDQMIAVIFDALTRPSSAKDAGTDNIARSATDATDHTDQPSASESMPAEPSREPPVADFGIPVDDPAYARIVEAFYTFMKDSIRDIREALVNSDFAKIATIAHSIKGTGGTVDCADISEVAQTLETMLSCRNHAGIEAAIVELERCTQSMSPTVESVETRFERTKDNFDRQLTELEENTQNAAACSNPPADQPGSSPDQPSIVSSLPTDDPDVRQLIEGFIARLHKQLNAMDAAWQASDFDEINRLALWLKRSAGSVGFNEFTNAAQQLAELATIHQTDELHDFIKVLHAMADRIVVSTAEEISRPVDEGSQQIETSIDATERPLSAPNSQPQPLISSLPMDDPEFVEIVRGFVVRLHQKLEQMKLAMQQQDFAELANLAHWLCGSGGTVGLAAFMEPAATLEKLAKQQRADEIPCLIDQLVAITESIVVPSSDSLADCPVS